MADRDWIEGDNGRARAGIWRAPKSTFRPTRVLLVDVADAIPPVLVADDPAGGEHQIAATYVRWSGWPIGVAWTEIPRHGLMANAHADSLWAQLAPALVARAESRDGERLGALGADGLGPLPDPLSDAAVSPSITVVVATRDRPQLLDRCLRSLLALDYPTFDILVVDNAPSSDLTERLIAEEYADEPKVTRVQADRPGLAAAHNHGIAHASGEILAFTDDDVVVDPHWLGAIAAAFASASGVACVTGMIVPLRLDTKAQWWLEGYAGFSKGFERKLYDLAAHRPDDVLFPYAAGKLGSGANMAFSADVLREMGGFDVALGAGSGAYGGDDLAAFFEVVMRGHTLVYEPGAIVRHQHPDTEERLRQQVFGYGAGLTAYLTHTVAERPSRALHLVRRSPGALRYALSNTSERNRRRPADFPLHLRLREIAGMAAGPVAYVRTRLRRGAAAGDDAAGRPKG